MSDKEQVLAEPAPKDWAKYTRGLGKNIWKGLDIEQYIQSLRQEWLNQK